VKGCFFGFIDYGRGDKDGGGVEVIKANIDNNITSNSAKAFRGEL